MIYKINFYRWIALLLPTFFRRCRIYAFCRALCAPLHEGDAGIYSRFLKLRDNHIYRLEHNGQVCHLRKALNDAFGLRRGFDISDAPPAAAKWRLVKDECSPNPLLIPKQPGACLPVGDENNIRRPSNRFVVRIPQSVALGGTDSVRAIIDRYRLPSKHPVFEISDIQIIYKNEQSELS